MAQKKSFKSLPKAAKKAAFAQMDDDGTRKNKPASPPKSKEIISGHRISRAVYSSKEMIRIESPSGKISVQPASVGGKTVSNKKALSNFKKAVK